ncbi:transposase [Burkholderia cenocepacia]
MKDQIRSNWRDFGAFSDLSYIHRGGEPISFVMVIKAGEVHDTVSRTDRPRVAQRCAAPAGDAAAHRIARRPLANTRAVLNGVLWVIYSGATWSAMPRRYPSYQTCHRRFKAWHDTGALMRVMRELYGDAGVSLCNAVSARMRKHTQSKAAEARSTVAPAYRTSRTYRPNTLKHAA